MNKRTYKIMLGIIVIFLVFLNLLPIFKSEDDAKASTLQQGIADEIIRLHVIANSDSYEDQQLKLKVKEALVREFSPVFSKANTKEEARVLIENALPQINTLAKEIILANGYDTTVSSSLGTDYFPVKTYGKYTLPCGYYEALRIEIGKADGQNWWCIMFPPLCFIDSTYSFIPVDTDLKMKHILTAEEYNEIVNTKVKVQYKFKFIEYFKNIFG